MLQISTVKRMRTPRLTVVNWIALLEEGKKIGMSTTDNVSVYGNVSNSKALQIVLEHSVHIELIS
jgi:hypothetical protein